VSDPGVNVIEFPPSADERRGGRRGGGARRAIQLALGDNRSDPRSLRLPIQKKCAGHLVVASAEGPDESRQLSLIRRKGVVPATQKATDPRLALQMHVSGNDIEPFGAILPVNTGQIRQ
jgi:hypothetical protein